MLIININTHNTTHLIALVISALIHTINTFIFLKNT